MSRRVLGEPPPPERQPSQREHQRERTRASLVDCARSLIQSGHGITMPAIAAAAGVSEPTADRYVPDLLSILQEGFVGVWPSADELMPTLDECSDPEQRVAIAAEALARNVLRIQGAVRTMIALTIARPDAAGIRPGHRTGLIESALAPLIRDGNDRVERLRNDLAVVISAEALFTLLDLKAMTPDEAVASLVETATTLVRNAVQESRR